MDIPLGSIDVLLRNGFDRDDVAAFKRRRHFRMPDPPALDERLQSLRKDLGSPAYRHSVNKIVRDWPEILQYRPERIRLRIEELKEYAGMNAGRAARALNEYPAILGLAEERIRETSEVVRHLGCDPADYPQAFLTGPAIIRGRCVILHRRGDLRPLSASSLFQCGHAPFERRTKYDRTAVLNEDPGHAAFLAMAFL